MLMSDEVFLAGDAGPRWRARVQAARGVRRWTDRRLAQAEVHAPDGQRYVVRITRNWPLERNPFGPLSNVLPSDVSLPALIAANVYRRGKTGWAVQVVIPRSRWRAERVIWTRRRRDSTEIVDQAVSTAEAIGEGTKPWEARPSLGERFRDFMGWF